MPNLISFILYSSWTDLYDMQLWYHWIGVKDKIKIIFNNLLQFCFVMFIKHLNFFGDQDCIKKSFFIAM